MVAAYGTLVHKTTPWMHRILCTDIKITKKENTPAAMEMETRLLNTKLGPLISNLQVEIDMLAAINESKRAILAKQKPNAQD